MKKLFTFITCLSMSVVAMATNYPGNGKSGFGGPVGLGSLEITNSGDSITFKLIRGTGNMNDALVIYLDSKTGGFATTANFRDSTDGITKAISGYDKATGVGGSRAIFNFSTSFRPEFALSFKPGLPAKLVALADNGAFTLLETPALSNNTNTAVSYTVKIKASDIGLTSCISFSFMATCISTTAYRADEAIGDPMTGFVQGWTSYTSTTAPLKYSSCAAPAGLTVTNIAKTSAKLNWGAVPCAIGYQYQIRKKGTTAWTTGVTATPSKNVSGLVAATTYQWRVLTGCRTTPDTLTSGYTNGAEFTTLTAPSFNGNEDINTLQAELSISLSPNPAVNSSMLRVSGAKGAVSVFVSNLSGNILWQSLGNTNTMIAIPVNKLTSGMYKVMVKDDENSKVLNLIKE